jgi:hydroxyethylthiazole kinase
MTRQFDPGASLAALRERRPLVHQITNLVVMNETANLTLAVGALPVMAHALEEVEEMASKAGALVLNIGTLSPSWIESMLRAGKAANRALVPVVLDPVGAGATSYRTATALRLLAEVRVSVVRANPAEIAALCDQPGAIRGVESISTGDPGELADLAARRLGTVVAVTGATDHVASPTGHAAISNGVPLLTMVTGTGCMASALCGCFAAVHPDDPLAAAVAALATLGVAAEDAAGSARGPGSFHVNLYDSIAALQPEALSARARIRAM